MKIKTSELSGPALRYAVAKAEGHNVGIISAEQQWLRFTDGATPDELEKHAAVHAEIRAGMKDSICRIDPDGYKDQHAAKTWCYDTNWTQGGPIIERENITLIRVEDKSIPDAKGFWQDKHEPVWGAVVGTRHSDDESHNGYGDPCGTVYAVAAEDVVTGPTPLIAAMRCYVASKLGDEINVPEGLA